MPRITKLPNGRFRWRGQIHGRQREFTADTKASAAKRAREAAGTKPAAPILAKVWSDYLRIDCAADAPSTLASKRRIYNSHLEYLQERPIDEITIGDLERLRAMLLHRKLAASTVNNVVGVLRNVLRYAHRHGLRDEVPKVERVKAVEKPQRTLSAEEIDRLAASDCATTRAMVLLAADCGLRIGEILGLQWTDVLPSGYVRVHRSRSNTKEAPIGPTKAKNMRTLRLSPRLAEALEAIRPAKVKPGDLIVDEGHKHATDRLRRARKAAGFASRRVDPWAWHALRHTFCTRLARSGADIRTIQAAAGHANITTTARYMHTDQDALDAALAGLTQ